MVEPLVTAGNKTELIWSVPATLMPKRAVKILLNLVLIANDALVRGGKLHVGAELRENEQEIVIHAEGTRVIFDQTVRDTLEGRMAADQIDSRTAAAWMVYSLCGQNQGAIQIAQPAENELIVGAHIR